jgi:hypothetical protein
MVPDRLMWPRIRSTVSYHGVVPRPGFPRAGIRECMEGVASANRQGWAAETVI